MHVRLDFPSSKYSHDPADRPERIAGLLRKAGHTVELTEDRHPNPMPGGVHLDMDAVLLAAGSYDGALLKVLADSGEFFDLYVQIGRGTLGIAGGVAALLRLGSWTRGDA